MNRIKLPAVRKRIGIAVILTIAVLVLWQLRRESSAKKGPHASRQSPVSASKIRSGDDSKVAQDLADSASPGDLAGVFTYHNDLSRTGENLQEAQLTPSNVSAASFGKRFTIPVDGNVYAQPLYMAKVAVPHLGLHNVVYVVTENDTVYAFDADDPKGLTLWSNHLGRALQASDLPDACSGIEPSIGITGTPVIDPVARTLYVVALTFQDSVEQYWLHALDVSSGAEKPGSPVPISASVEGTGGGSQNGKITFQALLQLQRPGLALAGGEVYIGFGSNCDFGDFHGWLMAYDASTLKQTGIFVPTPRGHHGGIWQSGGAPAVDSDNNLFVVTGDGTFDAASGGSEYGDTVLKLRLKPHGNWTVSDYFTPFDQYKLDESNGDLGSSGTILLPDQSGPHPQLLVSGAKNGTIYVLDRNQLGRFNATDNHQIVQSFPDALPKIDSEAAYWEGSDGRWVYMSGVGGPLQAYSVVSGMLSAKPTSQSEDLFGYPGATPAISADGKANGIVWIVGTAEPDKRTAARAYFRHLGVILHNLTHEPKIFFGKILHKLKVIFHSPSMIWAYIRILLPGRAPQSLDHPAILRAYDATDLTNLLYDSREAPQNRDQADRPVKFVVPIIANGKVYFGTEDHLDVYGLVGK
jgi:hypothetical protein